MHLEVGGVHQLEKQNTEETRVRNCIFCKAGLFLRKILEIFKDNCIQFQEKGKEWHTTNSEILRNRVWWEGRSYVTGHIDYYGSINKFFCFAILLVFETLLNKRTRRKTR